MTPTPERPCCAIGQLSPFARGDWEESRHQSEEWIALARASGEGVELAKALTLLGTLLAITERFDASITAFDEAARVARDLGLATTLAFALDGLALLLPIEESGRALTLLDEASALATQIGSPMAVAAVETGRGWIATGQGEWQTALRTGVDSAEQFGQLGDAVLITPSFRLAGLALHELGYPEPAAVLFGKADAMSDRGRAMPPWGVDMLAAADAALIEALGEPQVATLAARGAAMDASDAVAYLRREVDRVEAAIDLALATLDEIAADAGAEIA